MSRGKKRRLGGFLGISRATAKPAARAAALLEGNLWITDDVIASVSQSAGWSLVDQGSERRNVGT